MQVPLPDARHVRGGAARQEDDSEWGSLLGILHGGQCGRLTGVDGTRLLPKSGLLTPHRIVVVLHENNDTTFKFATVVIINFDSIFHIDNYIPTIV